MRRVTKAERQKQLQQVIEDNPFLTDRELADKFKVSIQTIRLDRLELGIPEVRERTKSVASAYARLKSVSEGEVIGHLIKLDLNKEAESILETTEEMALQRSKIIRGHYIFAQANSLAVAVINAKGVLTGSANIKFLHPVQVGDKIKAYAKVNDRDGRKFYISVETFQGEKMVFCGNFIMFAEEKGA